MGIPHYTVNLVEEFERLSSSLTAAYSADAHPILPCLQQGYEVRVPVAESQGDRASYVATGHYARRQDGRGRVDRQL
jgi:tRNA U34 2-thiouridine synthase MnmA/TrmU